MVHWHLPAPWNLLSKSDDLAVIMATLNALASMNRRGQAIGRNSSWLMSPRGKDSMISARQQPALDRFSENRLGRAESIDF